MTFPSGLDFCHGSKGDECGEVSRPRQGRETGGGVQLRGQEGDPVSVNVCVTCMSQACVRHAWMVQVGRVILHALCLRGVVCVGPGPPGPSPSVHRVLSVCSYVSLVA